MTTAASQITFDAERHLYTLRGLPVPSVTQVLRSANYVSFYQDLTDKIAEGALSPADGVYALIQRGARLTAARDRGQRVHAALQYMLEDDLDDSSLDAEVRGYLESGRAYLAAHVTEMKRAEMRVYSLRHGFAGTCDLLAVHDDGFLSVDDFKSGEPDAVAADLQTAAYLGALLEMAGSDAELWNDLKGRSPPCKPHRSSTAYFEYTARQRDWPW